MEEKDETIFLDGQGYVIEHSTGLIHIQDGDNTVLAFDEVEFLAKHLLKSNSINL